MKPFKSVADEYAKLFEGEGRLLTNMDEFRASALEFQATGKYTSLTPSPSRNSQYYKFWKEESRRCVEGYHTGYDFIPGYYYHYLNYSPIHIVNEIGEYDENENNLVQSERIIDFPKVWDGDYYTFHYINEAEESGEHSSVLKTRGRGFSFKGGSMLSRNYTHIPNSKSFAFATAKDYLVRDGVLTKAWDVLDFINEHTPWAKKRHVKNQDLHKRASYIEVVNGVPIEKGFKSEIIGITFNNNPDAGRGIRGKLILWEEFGNFPDGLRALRVALNSMKQGRSVFGHMLFYGTGGSDEASFEAIEEITYNPRGYQIHPIKNVFDTTGRGKECGFFFPVSLNYEGCYDENGNSDIIKSTGLVEKERTRIEENTTDVNALARAKAEEPLTIQEALLRFSSNFFPVNDSMTRRIELESKPEKYQKAEYTGHIVLEDGLARWVNSSKQLPIRNFPLRKGDNKNGCIVLYEPAIKVDGEVPKGIYIAGTDPYDQDESKTDSLGSTFILNLLTNRIVAEYTGRPDTAEEYYENVRRLLILYNADTMYENNLKGMYTYFKNKNSLNLLARQPKILRDISPDSTINRGYGCPATAQVNRYSRGLFNTFLRETNPLEEVPNVMKIRSIPLLKEIESWNGKDNFDRVSAMGMLMVYKAELNKNVEELRIKVNRDKKKKNGDRSSFLKRNYYGHKKII
jgi:hypothetical protein